METTPKPATQAGRGKYPRPPIQEAVCEIHFNLANPLDQAALETIRPRWVANYPHQAIVAAQRIGLHFAMDKMEASQEQIGHKLIARSTDGKNLAQLGPAFLAVNRLNPYLGWEELFRDLILERFAEVSAAFQIETIHQVGLRYINRIDLPQRPLHWKEWLAVSPPLPAAMFETGGDFQLHFRRALADDLECLVMFATVLTPSTELTSLLLDLNIVWTGKLPASSVAGVLESVHGPHRDLFEGFLLDKTRALFYISS